jgi:hypothetical protein
MPHSICNLGEEKLLHRRGTRGRPFVLKEDYLTAYIFRKSAGYPWPDEDEDIIHINGL